VVRAKLHDAEEQLDSRTRQRLGCSARQAESTLRAMIPEIKALAAGKGGLERCLHSCKNVMGLSHCASCFAAELQRASGRGEDTVNKFIKLRLRLNHAKRLEAFVGVTTQQQQQYEQDTILLADDDKKLVEVHSAAKELLADMPKLQEQ